MNILGTEIDKKGDTLIINRSDFLAFSPAYTFFIREIADLIDSKNGNPFTSWEDNNTEIIWAELDKKIIGILCYNKEYVDSPWPFLAINLTATHKDFRQRGIHTIMNKYFENRAVELGCLGIRATVNVNNSVRLITAKKDNLHEMLRVYSNTIDTNEIINDDIDIQGPMKLLDSPIKEEFSDFLKREQERLTSLGYNIAISKGILDFKSEDMSVIWTKENNKVTGFIGYIDNKIKHRVILNVLIYSNKNLEKQLFNFLSKIANDLNCKCIFRTVGVKDEHSINQSLDLKFEESFKLLFKKVNYGKI